MKKILTALFLSFLMMAPVTFVSCGDDDDDAVENKGNHNQGSANPLIGSWVNRDSIEVYTGFYWYTDQYQKYEKDVYYDIYVKKQGTVETVEVYRYGYTFDGKKVSLNAYPGYGFAITIEGNKFHSATTEFTRVSEIPQAALDKISKGDFEDMDADDSEE